MELGLDEEQRYLGCLLGLAVGDAVGTTAEFAPRGSFEPITDMVGGGPFDLTAGAWTDDTSMALCLGHSLVHCRGFDARDQMNRYCNWAEYGYMSSTGDCFDIGVTVRRAMDRYRRTDNPFSGSTDPQTAGNGSIMRLAPVPMYYALSAERAVHFSGESARTTHGAAEAVDCTRLFGAQLRAALRGADKPGILAAGQLSFETLATRDISSGRFLQKSYDALQGSGYVIRSLEAALWCFHHGHSFEESVLLAANLGEDADTTAAICGQIAGAYYGFDAIPQAWRERLQMRMHIEELALRLLALREAPDL